MYFFPLLLFLSTIIGFGQPANILVILPFPFYSHINNFMPIFKELAIKGHNVTLVSPFPQKKPISNLNEIVLPNLIQEITASTPKEVFELDSIIFRLTGLWNVGLDGAEVVLQLDQMKALIADTDSKFDLIITETFFVQESFVAFGHKYNAPVINLMSTILFPLNAHFTGNYLPVSYLPMIHFAYSDHMAFHERLVTTFFYVWEVLVGDLYYLRKQDAIMRKHFNYPGSENLPPLTDLLRKTSLTLANQHLAFGYQMPLHKNIVFFGGINIKRSEQLPQDLQTYLDKAKQGVIYFSFGSFFNISMLKPFMREAILSALGKVKQKVLMKAEDPALLKGFITGNVEIRKWFPQTSVLAHPNCKLFITHCGLNGLLETIYYAKPVVGIPLAADQKFNAKFIESIGAGEIVDIETITEAKLLNAINAVLDDTKYQKVIEERSAILKDNPLNVMDNVIYWIEYVIRYKGAPHLRPAVLDLHWYQYLMLDVIAFYLLIIFLIVYIIIKTMKLFLTWLFSRKNVKCNVKKSKKE